MSEQTSTFAKCIAQLLEVFDLKANELATRIDVKPAAISHFLSGRNNPSFEVLQNIISAFPELNPQWLLLGHGEMFLPSTLSTPSSTASQENITSSPAKEKQQTTSEDILSDKESQTRVSHTATIKVNSSESQHDNVEKNRTEKSPQHESTLWDTAKEEAAPYTTFPFPASHHTTHSVPEPGDMLILGFDGAYQLFKAPFNRNKLDSEID